MYIYILEGLSFVSVPCLYTLCVARTGMEHRMAKSILACRRQRYGMRGTTYVPTQGIPKSPPYVSWKWGDRTTGSASSSSSCDQSICPTDRARRPGPVPVMIVPASQLASQPAS